MGPATRSSLHWVSTLVALPAIAYAGLPFFRRAWGALRHGRTDMNVPISLGVLLVSGMSLVETCRARRVMQQNLVLSIGYDARALPFAAAGYVTPSLAAAAMSGSSLLVMGNALRLNRRISR